MSYNVRSIKTRTLIITHAVLLAVTVVALSVPLAVFWYIASSPSGAGLALFVASFLPVLLVVPLSAFGGIVTGIWAMRRVRARTAKLTLLISSGLLFLLVLPLLILAI